MKKKIGLVLAGGGAKGAYGFGCLKALKEHQIHFDGVSGTSVGALNAFLWSSDSLEKGEEFYKELSFSSVYPFKKFHPRYFEKQFLLLNFILVVIPRIIWSAIKGEEVPNAKIFRFIGAIFVFGWFLLISFIVSKINPSYDCFSFKNIMIVMIPGLVMTLFYKMLPQDVYMGYLSFFVLIYLISNCFDFIKIAVFWQFILGLVCIILTVTFGIGAFFFFEKLLASNNRSVFDSLPLQKKLGEIIEGKALQIPTWVTLATNIDLFDPDDPGWHFSTPPHSWGRNYEVEKPDKPTEKSQWVPYYFRIDSLDTDSSIIICAGSAALPYGLVSSPEINGKLYVDGGIIDNCPILPLLETNQFDEIFIVLLAEQKADLEALLQENKLRNQDLSAIQRIIDLAGFQHSLFAKQSYKDSNHPPVIIPFRDMGVKPKMHFFYPKQNLGGWFAGTLNFSGKYASRLMEMGYQDTKKQLIASGF